MPPSILGVPAAVVRRVDHLPIRTDQPEELFTFLTESLGLPVGWPLRQFGLVLSGGVFVGNVYLEVARFGRRPARPEAGSSNAAVDRTKSFVAANAGVPSSAVAPAALFGISFQPHSMRAALAELARRRIPHGPPLSFRGDGPDGMHGRLWTTALLGGLLDGSAKPLHLGRWLGGDSFVNRAVGEVAGRMANWRIAETSVLKAIGDRMLYLTEFSSELYELWDRHPAEMAARGGGPLGLVGVREVIIGVKDFAGSRSRWSALLAPIPEPDPGCWRPAEGPAIRLVEDRADNLKKMVWDVRSLPQAAAFLRERGWLVDRGEGPDDRIGIEPAALGGVRVEVAALTNRT